MEMYRYLWIVYTSAKGLEPVKLSDKMEVYAYVSISGGGGPKTKQKTTVDRDGGTNPTWNDPMNFMVEAESREAQILVFELRCELNCGDKDIGEVHVPVNHLIGSLEGNLTYPVQTPSGELKGELNFIFEWVEKVTGRVLPPAVGVNSAYPPPYAAAAATTSGYPPPSPGTGRYHAYPQVPVLGYGYPPPPPGYGHPSPQPGYGYPMLQQPAENNKLGGLGRWLGRVFAGAAISDMLTHASDGDGDGDGDAGF